MYTVIECPKCKKQIEDKNNYYVLLTEENDYNDLVPVECSNCGYISAMRFMCVDENEDEEENEKILKDLEYILTPIYEKKVSGINTRNFSINSKINRIFKARKEAYNKVFETKIVYGQESYHDYCFLDEGSVSNFAKAFYNAFSFYIGIDKLEMFIKEFKNENQRIG